MAKEVLREAQKKTSFILREQKIVPGETAFEIYHERIPVILIDGEFAFQYKVSEWQLLERLKS